MSEPIVYVDRSEVREGALEDLKKGMSRLSEFVAANEPRIVAYSVHFTEDGTQMSVVHVHPDPASLEFHLRVAGPLFSELAGFVNLLAIDVYGAPTDTLLGLLRQKAQLLGQGTVRVHGLHAGFSRLAGPTAD